MTPIVHGVDFAKFYHANVLVQASVQAHRKSFAGAPLSVKSVVRGEATWRVAGRSFTVDRTSCLIVERDTPFELEVAAGTPAGTFAVFFADGFASDVATVRMRSLERLLDDPSDRTADAFPIAHRLWPRDTAVPSALHKLRAIDAADTPRLDAQPVACWMRSPISQHRFGASRIAFRQPKQPLAPSCMRAYYAVGKSSKIA